MDIKNSYRAGGVLRRRLSVGTLGKYDPYAFRPAQPYPNTQIIKVVGGKTYEIKIPEGFPSSYVRGTQVRYQNSLQWIGIYGGGATFKVTVDPRADGIKFEAYSNSSLSQILIREVPPE